MTMAVGANDFMRALEQAGRAQQQHDDEDEENADLAERLAEKESGQAFHHADDEGADDRSRHRAHAAQHHDGEGNQHKGVTHAGIDVISRDQQARRDRDAGRAETEGHRIDVGDVDPHQLGAELLLGDSANGTADIGKGHQQPQRQGHDKDRDKADNARHRQVGHAEIERLERVRNIDRARIAAKVVKQRVLDDDGNAERYQQHVAIAAVRRRTDDKTLQPIAKHEKERRQQKQRHVRVEPEQLEREEHGEQRRTQKRAMRKIDDVEDAIDQRQPKRDKRIDRAHQQTVEDGRNEDGSRQHKTVPPNDPRTARKARRPRNGCCQAGIGNTGFALANVAGNITLMSLSSTCVFTGAAPSFCPLTNLVGP